MKLLPFIGLSSLVNLFSIFNAFARAEMVSATPRLAAHVGKYVYDEVDGTRFLNHPQVCAAIEAAVPAGDLRDILYAEDAVVTPIINVGEKAFSLAMMCPSEASEIEASFGDWSIGSILG